MDRKKLIALAHMAASRLGLDEDDRRAVQVKVTGAASCKDMDEAALMRLISYYKRSGADVHVPSGLVASPDRAPLIRKIAAQSAALGVPYPEYALGIVRHMQRGVGPERLEWCPAPLLTKVVAALSYQQKRKRCG